LINQKEQEFRFRDEIEQIKQEQGRIAPMPDNFLKAVSNLPECAGIAMGIDRLVMLFCNADSIDEVLPFTIDDA
jgi:lysyl-tRNA synthetase class 2